MALPPLRGFCPDVSAAWWPYTHYTTVLYSVSIRGEQRQQKFTGVIGPSARGTFRRLGCVSRRGSHRRFPPGRAQPPHGGFRRVLPPQASPRGTETASSPHAREPEDIANRSSRGWPGLPT